LVPCRVCSSDSHSHRWHRRGRAGRGGGCSRHRLRLPPVRLPAAARRGRGIFAESSNQGADVRPLSQQLLLALNHFGLSIVIINVLVDQLGLPVPAVPTLIVAALSPQMANSRSAGCSWSGARVPGRGLLLYVLGQIFGIRVLKTLCRISLEPDSASAIRRTASSVGASIRSSSPNSCQVWPSLPRRWRRVAHRMDEIHFLEHAVRDPVGWHRAGRWNAVQNPGRSPADQPGSHRPVLPGWPRPCCWMLHRLQVVGTRALLQDAAHGTHQRRRPVPTHAEAVQRRLWWTCAHTPHAAWSRAGYPGRFNVPLD